MTYEEWEVERKRLWDMYRTHYEQSQSGLEAANLFVFEHCILERRLCDEGRKIEGLTDEQTEQLNDIDHHSTSIIDQLYTEAQVPLDAQLGDVDCRRCGRLKRGYKVYVNLPAQGRILQDVFCNTCK